MIVLDLSILNQKGTPMFNSDTFANRPAFGIVGRIFISTDTKEFFRDTGTSWELIGGPGSGTITGTGAAGQVTYFTGATSVAGSNNLFWDAANNHLGINTNTPGTALDIHHNQNTILQLNQTTATNDTRIAFQNSGTALWRIGNFYTAGANDFGVFDVVSATQQFTILNTTGQTFIGAKTTAAGRLVVNSATADAHLQIVGANAPSIRIDNAGSGGTQRFVFGLATATNNFIQGAVAGQFCISTQSSGAMLFGMWQTTNASEVMRISTANNLIVGSSNDNGNRFQVTGAGYFSGNLGIGTSTPTSYSGFNTLAINNATNGGLIDLMQNGIVKGQISCSASQLEIVTAASLPIIFYTNNTERSRIFGNGNFGIGTGATDNGNRFQVTGSASITGTTSTMLSINSTFATGYSAMKIDSSGTEKGLIGFGSYLTTDAGLAIRTASGVPFTIAIGGPTPTLTLSSSGAATFSSSIAINNSVAAAVAAPSTHKVAILIGGVQYYLLASNV